MGLQTYVTFFFLIHCFFFLFFPFLLFFYFQYNYIYLMEDSNMNQQLRMSGSGMGSLMYKREELNDKAHIQAIVNLRKPLFNFIKEFVLLWADGYLAERVIIDSTPYFHIIQTWVSI